MRAYMATCSRCNRKGVFAHRLRFMVQRWADRHAEETGHSVVLDRLAVPSRRGRARALARVRPQNLKAFEKLASPTRDANG